MDFPRNPSDDGFKDGINTDDDYSYDAYGNMTKDQNKNITLIKYNHLNLPTEIQFGTLGNIKYIYNATGQKVSKIVSENSVITTHHYQSGYQYENGNLQYFPHAEGYVNVVIGAVPTYNYVYQYKDHLGNNRLIYATTTQASQTQLTILEESHYYPFGLKHAQYNSDHYQFIPPANGNNVALLPAGQTGNYQYKYNGKEYQDELGLNMYDYGARNYDPAIGRWMNIDPLAEQMRRHSPYNYAFNNPMRFVDPDGMKPLDTYRLDSTTGLINKVDDKKYYDENGNEVDKLIVGDKKVDENGNIKNDHIDVKNGVLDNMEILTDIVDIDGVSTEVKGFHLDFGPNSYDEARTVFNFISNNSNVNEIEYSFINASQEGDDNNSESHIYTSGLVLKEYFGAKAAKKFARAGVLKEHTHNHPLTGTSRPSDADEAFKKAILLQLNIHNERYQKKIGPPTLNIYYNKRDRPY